MESSSTTPGFTGELAELRRRAYGRDADIDTDPAAVERLRFLEAAARVRLRETSVPDATDAASVAADPRPSVPVAVEPAPVPSPRDGAISKARQRRRRLTWIAVGVGIVAALAAGAVLTSALTPHPDHQLARVETSAEDRLALVGEGVGYATSADLQEYEKFRGVSLWSSSNLDGGRCLILVSGESGFSDGNCTPGGLDPTVDLFVFDGGPVTPQTDLPAQSIVRFVLHGDRVQVWIDRATSST